MHMVNVHVDTFSGIALALCRCLCVCVCVFWGTFHHIRRQSKCHIIDRYRLHTFRFIPLAYRTVFVFVCAFQMGNGRENLVNPWQMWQLICHIHEYE